MRKIILLFIVFLFALQNFSNAQEIQMHHWPNHHVDYARLKRIDGLVNSYINNKWLTGLVTLVIKDNQVILYNGYGYMDYEAKKPMANNAIFRIASQTKALTSAGILILYEQGKLQLDEPISDFISTFKDQRVIDKYNASDTSYTTIPAKREITFRDLLTHTSGIDYAAIGSETMKAIYAKANIPSGLGKINENLVDRMTALGKLPLSFQPGEKWQYSLSTDLLGGLIEVISGTNLQDFLTKNIFLPLGMKDTYFNVPLSKADRMANVYTEDKDKKLVKWGHTFRGIDADYPFQNKTYFSGGAGLSCTAYDYAIFLQMIMNGGIYNGHKILAKRTAELMVSPQLDFNFDGVNNFGLGFKIFSQKAAERESINEGSFGWGGYFGTVYWADPKEKLICLIMTQQGPNSHADLMKKIETMIYSSLK